MIDEIEFQIPELSSETSTSTTPLSRPLSRRSSHPSPQPIQGVSSTFFQVYQIEQQLNIVIEDPQEEYDDDMTTAEYEQEQEGTSDRDYIIRYYRTESGRIRIFEQIEKENRLVLSNGYTIRFRDGDERRLILPDWFESSLTVRKIVASISRNVKKRLRFLNRFMDEEEGYDKNGNMIYYHLRDQVFESYLVETRLRNAMRKVLVLWRNYSMKKRTTETIDPIILSEPEKPVVIYDWKAKKRFTFDAKSLAIFIETQLLYHEVGFACPQNPRNPWTNLDFTYRELVSIYFQLKKYGELRWGLTTLRQVNFNLVVWFTYNKTTLIIKSIHNNIKQLDTEYARELLEDFIFKQIEDLVPLTDIVIKAYRKGIEHDHNHWYIQRWKHMAMKYYEANHFGFNIECELETFREALLKRQYIFIKDMYKRGYIDQRFV